MIIYNVITDDRNLTPTVKSFSKEKDAVKCAKEWATERITERTIREDYKEEPSEGWIFYAIYSDEGDFVWVVATELDGE